MKYLKNKLKSHLASCTTRWLLKLSDPRRHWRRVPVLFRFAHRHRSRDLITLRFRRRNHVTRVCVLAHFRRVMVFNALNHPSELLFRCLFQTDLQHIIPVIIRHQHSELPAIQTQLHQQTFLILLARIGQTFLNHIAKLQLTLPCVFISGERKHVNPHRVHYMRLIGRRPIYQQMLHHIIPIFIAAQRFGIFEDFLLNPGNLLIRNFTPTLYSGKFSNMRWMILHPY